MECRKNPKVIPHTSMCMKIHIYVFLYNYFRHFNSDLFKGTWHIHVFECFACFNVLLQFKPLSHFYSIFVLFLNKNELYLVTYPFVQFVFIPIIKRLWSHEHKIVNVQNGVHLITSMLLISSRIIYTFTTYDAFNCVTIDHYNYHL